MDAYQPLNVFDDGNLFYMDVWTEKYEEPDLCGTVRCIGGTADWLIGKPVFLNKHAVGTVLHTLFYPKDAAGWRATPQHAADVIEHYLLTGKVDWRRKERK